METNDAIPVSRAPKNIQERLKRFSRFTDKAFPKLTLVFALIVAALLVSMVVILSIDALPAFRKFGLEFFGSSSWNPVTQQFGALPAIYGTLLSALIAMIFAIPISLGAAIFLTELAPSWLRSPASFLIEMLAAIPSVIIGLWGIFVLVPIVRHPIETWLGRYLGFIPLFHGPPLGFGFLASGMILAIMIIPIITAISRDAIKAVPQTQKEAMLALGATRWETISKAVIPYCRSGLIGAVILGLGRAVGETMAVLMVIGNSYNLTASLFSPGTTIASKIASEFGEAADMQRNSLLALALILFAVTLLVNVAARLLVWRLTAVKEEKE